MARKRQWPSADTYMHTQLEMSFIPTHLLFVTFECGEAICKLVQMNFLLPFCERLYPCLSCPNSDLVYSMLVRRNFFR